MQEAVHKWIVVMLAKLICTVVLTGCCNSGSAKLAGTSAEM
jgi:hypothetical protein